MPVIDRPFLSFPPQLISSVWSPQSIEFSLQQSCLPFLRLSCLLQHHLYGDGLTGCLVRCPGSPHRFSHNFCFFCEVTLLAPELEDVFGVNKPILLCVCVCHQEEEEFLSLAVCLGLLPSAPQPSSMVHSATCLQWAVNAFDLVTQWCAEVTGPSQMQTEQSLVRTKTAHLSHWLSIRLKFC